MLHKQSSLFLLKCSHDVTQREEESQTGCQVEPRGCPVYRLRVGGVEDVDSDGGVAQHTEGPRQQAGVLPPVLRPRPRQAQVADYLPVLHGGVDEDTAPGGVHVEDSLYTCLYTCLYICLPPDAPHQAEGV